MPAGPGRPPRVVDRNGAVATTINPLVTLDFDLRMSPTTPIWPPARELAGRRALDSASATNGSAWSAANHQLAWTRSPAVRVTCTHYQSAVRSCRMFRMNAPFNDTTKDAPPQRREFYCVIQEKPGTNPVPPRSISGEALTAYWLGLVRHVEEKRVARERPGEPGPSRTAYRYSCKIEIGVYETLLAFLHHFIAPDEPATCERACGHMEVGMTPEQVKRYLDTLDAYLVSCRARMGRRSFGDQVWEDLELEVYEVGRCREHLAGILKEPPESR